MNTKGYHVRHKDLTEYSWFGILFCVRVSNDSEKVEQERMWRINSVFFCFVFSCTSFWYKNNIIITLFSRPFWKL